MTSVRETRFMPDPRGHATYDELFGMYRELHDAFGGVGDGHESLGTLMKRLLALKERSTAQNRAVQ
jgi:L-ribulokinase